MKNAFLILAAGVVVASIAMPAMAGISKIEKWGASPDGSSPQYKVTCTNGRITPFANTTSSI